MIIIIISLIIYLYLGACIFLYDRRHIVLYKILYHYSFLYFNSLYIHLSYNICRKSRKALYNYDFTNNLP